MDSYYLGTPSQHPIEINETDLDSLQSTSYKTTTETRTTLRFSNPSSLWPTRRHLLTPSSTALTPNSSTHLTILHNTITQNRHQLARFLLDFDASILRGRLCILSFVQHIARASFSFHSFFFTRYLINKSFIIHTSLQLSGRVASFCAFVSPKSASPAQRGKLNDFLCIAFSIHSFPSSTSSHSHFNLRTTQ